MKKKKEAGESYFSNISKGQYVLFPLRMKIEAWNTMMLGWPPGEEPAACPQLIHQSFGNFPSWFLQEIPFSNVFYLSLSWPLSLSTFNTLFLQHL